VLRHVASPNLSLLLHVLLVRMSLSLGLGLLDGLGLGFGHVHVRLRNLGTYGHTDRSWTTGSLLGQLSMSGLIGRVDAGTSLDRQTDETERCT